MPGAKVRQIGEQAAPRLIVQVTIDQAADLSPMLHLLVPVGDDLQRNFFDFGLYRVQRANSYALEFFHFIPRDVRVPHPAPAPARLPTAFSRSDGMPGVRWCLV